MNISPGHLFMQLKESMNDMILIEKIRGGPLGNVPKRP